MAEAFLNQAERRYSGDDLGRLLQSEAWRALTPNFSTVVDLDPSDLDPEIVEEVVDAMLDPGISMRTGNRQYREYLWQDSSSVIELPNRGELRRAPTHGESQIEYTLDLEGKVMTVVYGAYRGRPEPQIPLHPHLTPQEEGWSRRLWQYSDPRTYLLLPTSHNTCVSFQEWGGTNDPMDMSLGISPRQQRIARQAAHSRALGVIAHVGLDNANPEATQAELLRPGNYYFKSSYLTALARHIPIEQRIA